MILALVFGARMFRMKNYIIGWFVGLATASAQAHGTPDAVGDAFMITLVMGFGLGFGLAVADYHARK